MGKSRLAQSDEDAILPVSIGTGVWVVTLVILLLLKPRLDDAGTTWWILAAVVGVVTGIGGLVFLRWRRSRKQSLRD